MFGVLRPEGPTHGTNSGRAHDSPPPPNSMAPMPITDFATREEVLAGAKNWSAMQGYAIVIARSRHNRLWLKCDRGGKYENRRSISNEQRKRKRGDSRLQGCPFRMIAALKRDTGWHIECDRPQHNHGPSEDLSAHPTLRRMTEAQLDLVHKMCEGGNTPADTVRELKRLWPEIKILTRDVYNARKKYKTLREETTIGAETADFDDDSGQGNETEHGQDAADTGRSSGGDVGNDNPARNKRRRLTNGFKASASARKKAAPGKRQDSHQNGPILDPRLQGLENGTPLPTAYISQAGTTQTSRPTLPPYTHSNTPLELQGSLIRALASEHTDLMNSSSSPASPSDRRHSAYDPHLLSRINTIEREQREQRNMLTEILGAVRGMQTAEVPPSSEGSEGAQTSASAGT